MRERSWMRRDAERVLGDDGEESMEPFEVRLE